MGKVQIRQEGEKRKKMLATLRRKLFSEKKKNTRGLPQIQGRGDDFYRRVVF